MGICINYFGRLANPDLAQQLVGEMRALCRKMEWWHMDMEELIAAGKVYTKDLVGISLTPHPKCEWVNLHFDPQGRLVNDFYYAMLHDKTFGGRVAQLFRNNNRRINELLGTESARNPDQKIDRNGGENTLDVTMIEGNGAQTKTLDLAFGVTYNWTKTQHAGLEAHVAVCRVLAYVKKYYAPDLEVHDETGYFEHGDLKQAAREIGYMDYQIETTRRALEGIAEDARRGTIQRPATLPELLSMIDRYLCEVRSTLH
ncbi:MAG: hypothetical protein MJE77_00200 [Proteobacteria bacterium]|nr:hypothetical protein [Pseudomonadota bacterium]